MATTSFFFAGCELVRCEIRALGTLGPYRLAVHHASGDIVEYFRCSSDALARQVELEALLTAARGTSTDVPSPSAGR